MILAMAALGLPALGNFVAEFLILLGTYRVSPSEAIIASVGLVLATVYALWMIQRVFHGRLALEAAHSVPPGHADTSPSALQRGHMGGRSSRIAPKTTAGRRLPDLSAREIGMMAVCVIVLLWLGLYPQTFMRTAKPTVDSLQRLAVPATQAALPTTVTITPRWAPVIDAASLSNEAVNPTTDVSDDVLLEAKR